MRGWPATALLALVLALGLFPRLSLAACPPRESRPVVIVDSADSGVSYHFDATVDQLMSIASKTGGIASPNMRGLTVVRLDSRMSITNTYVSDGTQLCAYPSKVEVFVGFQSPQSVYVLGRYPPGSCQYDVIQAHENGHVRINSDTLKALVPQLKAGLEEAVSNPGYPVSAPSKEWAQEAIRNSLTGLLRSYVDAHVQQRAQLNGMLDTPENYAATSRLCPSW